MVGCGIRWEGATHAKIASYSSAHSAPTAAAVVVRRRAGRAAFRLSVAGHAERTGHAEPSSADKMLPLSKPRWPIRTPTTKTRSSIRACDADRQLRQQRGARHRHHRYDADGPLLRAQQRQGDPLWDRRWPSGLHRSGRQQVARKAEWPDWYPPQEMIARQPYLPRMVAGGPRVSARRARNVFWQHAVSNFTVPTIRRTIGKHVSSRLHPPHQRGRGRSLQPRANRHQGDRAAAERAGADRTACACPHCAPVMERYAPVRPLLVFPQTSPDLPDLRAGQFFLASLRSLLGVLTLQRARHLGNVAQRHADRLHQRHRIGFEPRAWRVFQIGAEKAGARDQRRAEGARLRVIGGKRRIDIGRAPPGRRTARPRSMPPW